MILSPVLDASTSFAAHVLQPAARSLAFAGFAGLILAACRVRSVALRLTIWRTVLVVALAMPLLGLVLPPLPVFVPLVAKFVPATPRVEEIAPVPEIHNRAISVNNVAHSSSTKLGAFTYTGKTPNILDATNASGSSGTSGVTQSADAPAANTQPRRPVPWLAASAAIYFAVAIFMLMRLALGVVLGRRLERDAQLIEDTHALARLEFFSRAARLRSSPPRLAESELLSVPVTFGVQRPAILLPAGWRDWEPSELDSVLAHEISHVARRDALAERLSLLHRAIFWFSPLSWWLARHLADLAEEASDDAALAAGADRTRYAETLLGFFAALEAAPGRVWWQGVSMATAGQAEKRVDRILEWKGSVAMRLKKPVVIAYLLCAIPVVCLIAAFRPTIMNIHSESSQQTAPQTTEPPALPPLQSAQQPGAAAPVAAPSNAPQPSAAPAAAPSAAPVATPDDAPALAPMPSIAPVVSVHVVVPPIAVAPVISVHPIVAPMVRVVPIVPVPPMGGPVISVAPVLSVHPMVAPAVNVRPFVQTTTINGTRIGDYSDDTFAVVSGKSYVSVSSSHTSISTDGSVGPADSDSGSGFVNSLRHSFPGDFIWFIRDGKAYIIRDAATIKQAMEFFAPAQELGRQQEALGKQQEALGAQQEALGAKQEALGEQMEKVRVKIPDMTADLQKLEAELKQMGTDGTQDDLGRIQEKIGEIQERIGELQSKAGEEQSKLGEKQGALGEEQGKLGEQQGKLGEMQGKLGEQQEAASRKASREMKKLLDQAIASGAAKPA